MVLPADSARGSAKLQQVAEPAIVILAGVLVVALSSFCANAVNFPYFFQTS